MKDQDKPEQLQKRIEQSVNYIYKLIFYTTSSIVGYIIMVNTPVMPQELGGSGSMRGIFDGMPYQEAIPLFLEYSQFNLAYVLEDFVHHLFFKERHSDFWEMNLHHFVTVSLYWGMLM